jgi:RHS repeat-associated protein
MMPKNMVKAVYDNTTQNTERYLYDGNGQRVEKSGPTGTTVYVYDAFGQMAAEYSTAQNTSPCTTCYLTYDHLGSVRIVTDQSGNVVARHDYLPFGEEIPAGYAGRGSQWGSTADVDTKFTNQIRDNETGMDYFNARYYGSALGRFTSPDPMNAGADPTDPQSWNGSAYVNPLALIDPKGMQDQAPIPVDCPGCSITVTATGPGPIGSWAWWMDFGWSLLTGGFPNSGVVFHVTATGEPTTQTTNSIPNPAKKGNVFSCASKFARKYSAAGALRRFGIGTSGVGGFITNALGGNAFSGATDLIQSFGSGEAGGHNVFYNMAQGVAAGPTQGFGAAFGKSIEGTPLASGPVDVATAAFVTKGFSIATGAGQTIQTLNGVARLGSLGLDVGEVASGVGLIKFGYDALSYGAGLLGCKTGVIH